MAELTKRGVVLAVQGKWATVLTPDGGFVRVRVREDWWPGDEVSWSPGYTFYLRPALALACVLLMVLAGGGVAYQHYWALGPVVAYVSVDINPSLEFGVDARERVCTARALNGDGEEILSGLAFRRRPLQAVITDVTARATEKGYLRPDEEGAVLLTVTPVGARSGDTAPARPDAVPAPQPDTVRERVREWIRPSPPAPARIRAEVVQAAEELLQHHRIKAVVKGLATDPELRQEAQRLHVSTGRLALYLAVREAGIDIKLDELQHSPLGSVLKRAFTSPASGTPGDKAPGPAEGQTPSAGTAPGASPGREPGQKPAGRPASTGKPEPAGKPGTVRPGGQTPTGQTPTGQMPGGGTAAGQTPPGGEKQHGNGKNQEPGKGEGPGPVLPSLPVPGDLQLPFPSREKDHKGQGRPPDMRELLQLIDKPGLEKELPDLVKKFLVPGREDRENDAQDK
ncbi:MAG TPA: hypothetical protein GX513_10750 [Firmicutes bacterium]|nr:hypothetical protein [Bacillota bacterium]